MGDGEDQSGARQGQDQRAWEDQSGARQDRTRGRGGTSRGGPREQEAAAAAAAVGGCTPEGARGTGQSSSTEVAITEAVAAVPEQASQPVLRVGKGVQVSSSFASLKSGVGLYIGYRYLCNFSEYNFATHFLETSVAEHNFSHSSLFLFTGKPCKAFCTVVAPPVVR